MRNEVNDKKPVKLLRASSTKASVMTASVKSCRCRHTAGQAASRRARAAGSRRVGDKRSARAPRKTANSAAFTPVACAPTRWWAQRRRQSAIHTATEAAVEI